MTLEIALVLGIPIIFLTGHSDIPMAVQAVQAGAVDFLEKPIQGAALLERVQRALTLDEEWRHTLGRSQAIQQRYASPTSRERECMALAVSGLTSKEIARDLGISPRTVEVHRTHPARNPEYAMPSPLRGFTKRLYE